MIKLQEQPHLHTLPTPTECPGKIGNSRQFLNDDAAEFSNDAAQTSVHFCFLSPSFTGPLAAESGSGSPDVTWPGREAQSLTDCQ